MTFDVNSGAEYRMTEYLSKVGDVLGNKPKLPQAHVRMRPTRADMARLRSKCRFDRDTVWRGTGEHERQVEN